MSEQFPSMSDRTDSAPQSAKEAVVACVAALEAAEFVRPLSLSPDAYLAALADLAGDWEADLGTLASAYATLRFGGGTITVDDSTIVAAAEGIARRTDSLNQSGEIAALREAWRARFAPPVDPAKDGPVSAQSRLAVAAPSGSAADDALRTRQPTTTSRSDARRSLRFDLSRFPLDEPTQFLRRLSETSISLGAAATALVVAAAAGSIGTYCLPECLRTVRLAFESRASDDPVGMPGAPIVLVSPAPAALIASEPPEPSWPRLFPATHPRADEFNDVIAGSLSDMAKLYRGIGRPERAAAIYSYVAEARPDDAIAQIEYAEYLLHPANPEHRDPDRACVHAERAYALNSSDPRTIETLTAALFATGDVDRAAAIQQRWIEQERQAGIAAKAEDARATDRSAG